MPANKSKSLQERINFLNHDIDRQKRKVAALTKELVSAARRIEILQEHLIAFGYSYERLDELRKQSLEE